MPSSVNFNTIGFFNSILPLNQTNWAAYFAPSISDGVLAGIENEMEVYGNSSGMYVYVKTGECRVRSHRGVINTLGTLEIEDADLTYPRYDLVVARITYGNPSTMVITVKTGTPAASPSVPDVTQNAGDVWEIPLAEVYVPAGAVTIAAGNVTDRRYVYKIGNDSVTNFSGTSVTCSNDIEYRNETAINSLTIKLPNNPNNTFITGVNFTASASFTGVSFEKGGNTYSDMRIIGDVLTMKNKRYNLVIWWDSGFNQYWCASKGAQA